MKCTGCSVTNEDRSVRWFFRDALTGVGVCALCSNRRDAEQLRTKAIDEAAKRRAVVSA